MTTTHNTSHTPHTVESHTTQTQYMDITTLEDQGHTEHSTGGARDGYL